MMNKLLLCVFGDINNLNNNRELVRYHFHTKGNKVLVDGQIECLKHQGLE